MNAAQLREMLFTQQKEYKPLPGTIVPCLRCRKPFLMRLYTGTVDQICGECFTLCADFAAIVCRRCDWVVCKVPPQITPDGFYVRPMSRLHIDACNICKPGLETSTIIEISQWIKHNGGRKIIVPFGGSRRT